MDAMRRLVSTYWADSPFNPAATITIGSVPASTSKESNPERGLDFAAETATRTVGRVRTPFVIGAVIDLGRCLDMSSLAGIALVRTAYANLVEVSENLGNPLPRNSLDGLRRRLDCAVVRRVHSIVEDSGQEPIDTVRGVFTEGEPIYPGAGFHEKTHVQIAVRNPLCIKGVFRVRGDRP